MRRRLFCLAVIAGLVAGLAIPPAAAAETAVPVSRAAIAQSFVPVVQRAAPAVVNIYARTLVAGRPGLFADDPFFGPLFRDLVPAQPRMQNSLGSGVIVRADGLVVSNFHVVGMADEIRVVLADRREFAARVVLADEASDLAVLRIEGAGELPTLAFRDSDEVEVGELVLAIGNPFGVGQTVSMGIVSALARAGLGVGDGRGYFIQTDAAINPGNSGGALVDGAGRLVGINTAILTPTGGSAGIGFAIPSNLVAAVVAQAAEGAARFRRPWAGVAAQAVDAGMAEALGLARPEGVLLSDLHPESPFRAAGLRPGDLVTRIDGMPVNAPEEMLYRLSARGIGGTAEVVWLRDGAERRAAVRLAPPPDSPPRAERTLGRRAVLPGLRIARINPAVTEELGLDAAVQDGVVVIAAEGPAATVGLRTGDIILAVNGAAVDSPAAAERALSARESVWAIDILRDRQRLRLRFRT
jgi:Do/DeqQ family serine protease